MRTTKCKIVSLIVVAVLAMTLSGCNNHTEIKSSSSENQSQYSSAVSDTIEGKYNSAVFNFNSAKDRLREKVTEAQNVLNNTTQDMLDGTGYLESLQNCLDEAVSILDNDVPLINTGSSATNEGLDNVNSISEKLVSLTDGLTTLMSEVENSKERHISGTLSPVPAFTGLAKTNNGYEIEYSVSVTNWFRANDSQLLQRAWKAAGGKNDIPDIGSFDDYNIFFTPEKAVVAFGNISFKNITVNVDITSAAPVSFSLPFGVEDWSIKHRAKIYIGYGNSPVTHSFSKYPAISPNMEKNSWGPVPFMIIFSDGFTEKYPDGDPALKYFKINFSTGTYDYIAITLPDSVGESEPIDTLYPVIPNFQYSHYGENPKVSDGLYSVQDPVTELYGFIDTSGKIVINKEYERVSDFSNKRSIVTNKRGKRGVIDTVGMTIIPFEYSIIKENGIYFLAGKGDENTDIFDYNGNLLGTLPVSPDSSSLKYEKDNRLLAVQEKSKWKLVTPQKSITTAIYDSISIADDSIYAVLKYGTQEALATENGIVYDLGEYKYCGVWGSIRCSIHEYILIDDEEHGYAIANEKGILTDFYNISSGLLILNDKVITLCDYDYNKYLMYDFETQQAYFGTTEVEKMTAIGWYATTYSFSMSDGSIRLLDGTKCLSIERVGRLKENSGAYRDYYDYFVYTSLDNKCGLYFDGQVVVPAEYDTSEEAIAAFGVHKIGSENGKPIVVYGNDKTGYTPVIQYYKDNLYYDSIIDVGNEYYACCYDETWYLVKAEID